MGIADTNQDGNTNHGDTVQLSGFSGELSQTLQADASSRARRVSQIAAAVECGTYQVDAKAVGRAIINDALAGGVDADRDGDVG
jgi:anti-sigma28 factor (negative regulator of flagellin synthesis)